MTITLNSDYDVTLSTALLGYVGETNARPVSVEGLTVDGADRYVLTIDYGDGVTYEVDITGGIWTPTADVLRSAQTVSCQICAKKLSGDEYILVKKSRIFRLRIGTAIGDTAIPSPDVAMDALDRIDAIGRQAHADMQTAVTAAETATTAAENAEKSATTAGVSADTATQAASRAETAKTSAETSATQAETARQGAENARQQAVTAQNAAKVSAAQAATSAQQTTANKNITAGYAKTAKTNADSTAADRQAVQDMAAQVTADKATVTENAAKIAEDRTAAETAAQTAQSIADSLPEDYTTAVGKIAENTAEIGRVKLTDKELQRRVDALFDMGQGVTHRFETDTDTAYVKTIPTGAKLMSVKSVGGRSIVFNQTANVVDIVDETFDFYYSEVLFSGNRSKWTKGHKYLFEFYVKSNIEPFTTSIGYSNKESVAYNLDGESFSNVVTGRKLLLFTPDDSLIDKGYQYIGVRPVRYDTQKRCTISVKNLMIFDLTSMFGSGKEPSTVEEFEKIFPADYYPYNAGEIVSAGTEEVVEQGKNLFDYTDKTYHGANVNKVENGVIYTKGLTTTALNIPTIAENKYTLSFKVRSNAANQGGLRWSLQKGKNTSYAHDSSLIKSEVGYAANTEYQAVVTFVATTDFVSLCTITPMVYDVQLENGDTATNYSPFYQTEHQIPEAIRNLPGYGWSAGTARNYVDYENKQYHQCVGKYTFTGSENWVASGDNQYYAVLKTPATKVFDMNTKSNCLMATIPTESVNSVYGGTKTGLGINFLNNVSYAYISADDYNNRVSKINGQDMYYELANPIITDISNLIDDDFLRNVEVEAGGTITFKNSSNDSYRIPVPSEEEYIVKLSEVGGSV